MSESECAKPLDLTVRFFVACPRSGSTLLMRIFAESPECAVTSRLMLMNEAAAGEQYEPDHSIFQTPAKHAIYKLTVDAGRRFLISKEELGNDTAKGECLYNMLPDSSAYDMVRPVFLIRDPICVFDSWKSLGWTDVQSLIDCYVNLFSMLRLSASANTSTLLYERLVHEPRKEVQRICARWGIPFSDAMLEFTTPFGSFMFKSPREREIYCEARPRGMFTTVESNSTIIQGVHCHHLLTLQEKEKIERALCPSYLGCWKDEVKQLRSSLSEKQWFGFDLDDTLHEFRLASSKATNTTLKAICEKYGMPMEILQEEYAHILGEKTSGAFSDGKNSFEYRRERFALLLGRACQKVDAPFVESLLDSYENVLMGSLALKCGALDLLTTLKKLGKKIAVITEGPQDAQERTIQQLGISGQIDMLVTTNSF